MAEQSYLEELSVDTLKEAILVLEKIEDASGRKVREELLREHKSNPVLLDILRRALGKEKYYIRLSGEIHSSENRLGAVDSYKRFLAALQALHGRRLKGNAAREKMSAFLARCPPRLRKWFLRVLDHNLRLGISRTTVEKVYGSGFWAGVKEDEFHYHGCCLAKKYEDVYPGGKEPEFPVAAEFKIDGERALLFVFPCEPELQIYTRGKLRKTHIESVRPLIKQCMVVSTRLASLHGLPTDTPMFLDGEFLASDWNETSSVVGKTKNFDEEEFLAQTKILLFDWAPIDTYIAKKFELPWYKRKQLLMRAAGAQRTFEKVKQITDNIYILGHKKVYSIEELSAFHERSLDGGFEGTMLKIPGAPHVFNRNHTFVLKLKPEDDATGTIVAAVSGEGMHAAASPADAKKIHSMMQDWLQEGICEGFEDDGSYYHALGVAEPEQARIELQSLVKDSIDRRLSQHLADDTISYRYGPRLGYFVVSWNGEEIHVGGGIRFKAGQDDRMDFWERRKELIGTKIDFRIQKDKANVAKARFNKFVRLRLDLAEHEEPAS